MKQNILELFTKTRFWIVCILSLILMGCSVVRPEESPEIRTLTPQEALDLTGDTMDAHAHEFPDHDGHHTVLALSAGGADGAFGAGILAGWTDSGERPEFDVVTGVSTGALLAVFAFLGSEYDEDIRTLYTTQTNDSIFSDRGISGLLTDSLYDNAPLQAQIEAYITPEILDAIAVEHQRGRRLYIATTNLDAGELVIWDMGKVVSGRRKNTAQFFQKILRASAAVPAFFQPVYIKPRTGIQLRQAHVDGGVKEPVLYRGAMSYSDAPENSLYLVMNASASRFNASRPVEASLADIAQKSISELIRELTNETIFHHYVSAVSQGVSFHLTAIPDEIPIAQETLDFNPERMQKLFDAGYAIGAQGVQAWQTEPPHLYEDIWGENE